MPFEDARATYSARSRASTRLAARRLFEYQTRVPNDAEWPRDVAPERQVGAPLRARSPALASCSLSPEGVTALGGRTAGRRTARCWTARFGHRETSALCGENRTNRMGRPSVCGAFEDAELGHCGRGRQVRDNRHLSGTVRRPQQRGVERAVSDWCAAPGPSSTGRPVLAADRADVSPGPSEVAIGLFVATFVHVMLTMREVQFRERWPSARRGDRRRLCPRLEQGRGARALVRRDSSPRIRQFWSGRSGQSGGLVPMSRESVVRNRCSVRSFGRGNAGPDASRLCTAPVTKKP
jgi:hypothetical protein